MIELQQLSMQNEARVVKGPALIQFKTQFSVLFECLYSVYGLMMSNSRLCKPVHGMMRHGLRGETGMDEADAQRSYAVGTDYILKQEQREISAVDRSKRKKGVDHNKTKSQQQKLSEQLSNKVIEWEAMAISLLSRPNHGIPSVREVNYKGRRVQDKNNLKEQIATEKKKIANLTRDKLTFDTIKEKATQTTLSNDAIMKLGNSRLQLRLKIVEMSVQQFWKDLKVPDGIEVYAHISRIAWKSFPFLSRIVHRLRDATKKRSWMN